MTFGNLMDVTVKIVLVLSIDKMWYQYISPYWTILIVFAFAAVTNIPQIFVA